MIHAQKLLNLQTGMIFANPIPADKEANPEMIRNAIAQTIKEAEEQ